jgi:PhnB protein
MEARPYITFDGECSAALELYKRAFNTDTLQELRFSDMPPSLEWDIPEEYRSRVVHATLRIGDGFVRLSDCGPAQPPLNASASERVCIAVECSPDEVRHAFAVLAEEGRVGMELETTFYSPLAGVVFDKYGVMWNLFGSPESS